MFGFLHKNEPQVESASRPERLYLIGVAGHPNFGDEAITAGWLRWLAQHRPDDEVWIDTPNPSGAAALHHGIHPRATFVDTICRLAMSETTGSARERADAVVALLDDPGPVSRWIAGVDAFRSSQRVHLLGGGYLTGKAPEFAGLVAAAGWLHRHRGASAAATGLGMVPLSAELIELWREYADDFSVITVRDEPSHDGLGGIAALAPDDIFLGGLRQHVAPRAEARTIVLAQGDAHGAQEQLRDLVVRTLEAWQEQRPVFVEANPPVDGEIYFALRERFPAADFLPFHEVIRDGLPVGPNQRWITTRYHPHLLAAAHGARGVAIQVTDDYYGTKHRAVTAMGSGWPIIDVGSVDTPPEPGPAGDLPGRVVEHTSRLNALAVQIYGD